MASRGCTRLTKGRTYMVRRSGLPSLAVAWLSYIHCSAAQYEGCTNGTIAGIGDGQCNAENNNPSCGFDGGDVSRCCVAAVRFNALALCGYNMQTVLWRTNGNTIIHVSPGAESQAVKCSLYSFLINLLAATTAVAPFKLADHHSSKSIAA